MKKRLRLFTLLLCTLSFNLFGQNNPVENLTWSQYYEFPNNFFQLNWDEPAQPHGELIGYNIYRNDELYRFQTETSLYNMYTETFGIVTNCGEEFLNYNNGPFDIHVTAVYNPGQIESNYIQTVHSNGFALTNNSFESQKALLYPNPTNGIINIESENLEKITVYDISGKVINDLAPNTQIDLSNLPKGLYILKLFSNKGITVEKIAIK